MEKVQNIYSLKLPEPLPSSRVPRSFIPESKEDKKLKEEILKAHLIFDMGVSVFCASCGEEKIETEENYLCEVCREVNLNSKGNYNE